MAVDVPAPAPVTHPPAIQKTGGRRARKVLRYVLLTVGAIVIVFPLYMTVVNSLLPPRLLARQPPVLFPVHPVWGTYAKAWTEGHLGIYMRNSIIQTAII